MRVVAVKRLAVVGDAGAESARRPSLSRLIIEASPDVIYLYDRIEGRYPFVSGRSKAVLGYTPAQIEQLKGDGIERLIHPEDLPRARSHYARQESLGDDDVSMTTYRMAHARGDYRLLRCRQKVFSRTADGTVRCILGVATDITEQENAERQLRGLREQILHIRDEERRRLALQMHDTAVQHLVGAALLLSHVERDVAPDASGVLGEVHASLGRALRDILRPLMT
jgi:PAS domain S-box-containing protein